MLKNKDFSSFQTFRCFINHVNKYWILIMLINVKMPTSVGIFNIYEHDKFYAQLSWTLSPKKIRR